MREAGIAELVDRRVRLDRGQPGAASSGAKAATVIGAMLAGADSIDDCDVLRAGAASELFDDTRAPSTVGTWLRALAVRAVEHRSMPRTFESVCSVVQAGIEEGGVGPAPRLDANSHVVTVVGL